jgi:hypothetical protein
MVTVDDNTAKLAVLIDADNAQPAIIEGLLAEVAKSGNDRSHMPQATATASCFGSGPY